MEKTKTRDWRSIAEKAAVHIAVIAVAAWLVMLLQGVAADLLDTPEVAWPYWVTFVGLLALSVALGLAEVAWRGLRQWMRGDA